MKSVIHNRDVINPQFFKFDQKTKKLLFSKTMVLSINRRFHDVSEDITQVHEYLIFHRTTKITLNDLDLVFE